MVRCNMSDSDERMSPSLTWLQSSLEELHPGTGKPGAAVSCEPAIEYLRIAP